MTGVWEERLRELSAWAAEHGVQRLELTVRTDNERAIALYRRCGFEVEGTRRAAIRLGDRLADELFMAKLAV
jgi:RimJ/RimL family protein N-acetyltransferase